MEVGAEVLDDFGGIGQEVVCVDDYGAASVIV